VKARLVNIGNSRGVRLPKPLIEEAGLVDEVDLRVEGGAIVIAAARPPRTGWADAARRAATEDAVGPVVSTVPTHFDETEWQW
jgi:antitoxin MazE